METVLERGQGAFRFHSYYESLCALQSSVPLASVKANLDRNIIDIYADKIRLVDWPPILKAIQINKSLVRIAIHSTYESPLLEDGSARDSSEITPRRTPKTPNSKLRAPAVHARDVTYDLCKAIRSCLCVSEQITSLELEGLPLRPRDISQLAKGLSKCYTLRELSLQSCHIGDALTVLCDGLKNASTINNLNLSGCNLTDGAVQAISRVLTHQAVMRHNEAWKSSLRYRAPDLDCMPGLRRVTLNRNPLLGDSAAYAIADTLKDDLWLKAIDLQECGLTDDGAQALLEALKLNTTILVLDIRGNHLVSRNLVDRVIQQVLINSDGKSTQYTWLSVDDPKTPKRERGRSKTPSNRRKLEERTHVISPERRAVLSSVSPQCITPNMVPKQRGLPWRTAQRASMHKFLVSADKSSHDVVTLKVNPQSSETERDAFDDGDEDLYVRSLHSSHESIQSNKENNRLQEHTTTINTDLSSQASHKQLQAEIISLKRRLAEESKARLAAEDRALELARENRRLHTELRHSALHSTAATSGAGASTADDELLSQVETAFSKFNQFLDLVRDTGLGHLIQEAGLDQFASTSSPLPAPARHGDSSYTLDGKQSGAASVPMNFSDYVMERQIALQSDDIIRPTEPTDSPKKSYVELVTGSPTIAAMTAASPHQDDYNAETQKQDVSYKDKAGDGAELVSDNFKLSGAFDLKDVSELDSAKPSPRPDERKREQVEPLRQSQLTATTSTGEGAEDAYSSNDFTSESNGKKTPTVSVSKSERGLSASGSEAVKSYEESVDNMSDGDDTGEDNPAISNLKSLSELGSSNEHLSSL